MGRTSNFILKHTMDGSWERDGPDKISLSNKFTHPPSEFPQSLPSSDDQHHPPSDIKAKRVFLSCLLYKRGQWRYKRVRQCVQCRLQGVSKMLVRIGKGTHFYNDIIFWMKGINSISCWLYLPIFLSPPFLRFILFRCMRRGHRIGQLRFLFFRKMVNTRKDEEMRKLIWFSLFSKSIRK